ncbi:DNA-binding transcriptional regulator, MocR family, contains an aminotransferase domain [Thalassospira xiamenensis M-5 = DSM 17429]|uniref:aminotransferase-like domain-containing protein n=1 Tax=Thalassospira xiamenensis TaxID=220697 RepID=UPI0002873336|nr:DNA-binding transcriptional regulator, MocR family, contains an aminotransferase domain [Thalassospira xiamenensis M-5 = DSM 17429]
MAPDGALKQPDDGTLVSRVMNVIRDRIGTRNLLAGDRLPSIRGFARQMKVSNSTVVEAYDRLVAEGVIQARRGSGFYVAPHTAPLSIARIGPKLDRAIDPFWVSRQSLDARPDMLKPGCGWLPADWMPETAIRRALRSLSRADDATLVDYGTPLGLASLRHFLSRRMAGYGIDAHPDHLLLTESGTQAIDMLCRFLIAPGDTVLVDDPCYFNFQALLRAHRANIVGVPFTENGPDVDAFARIAATTKPRLYITNSGLHNPTGASLSPMVAHRVLNIAEQHDLIIIEDDIFADFENTPAPRMAALGGLERVIHIGSFSKTLSASVRCGYIAASADWIDGLTDLKIATGFSGPNLSAELIFAVLKDGTYRKYMETLRDRLARTMTITETRLRNLGITPAINPDAGLFLWCRLPDHMDAATLARNALSDGVVLAPGNVFSISQTAGNLMRFNVAQCQDERIFRVLERALEK